jgi:tetratricopeptide (TPR) repeat protein
MKIRVVFFILLAAFACALNAQPETRRLGDAELARQYVNWARQMTDAGRWEEALEGLERASDYSDVSSDISYLLAAARLHNIYIDTRCNRLNVIEALDRAIETNRWETYNKSMALLLKTQQLIIMRRYSFALLVLDQIEADLYPSTAVPSGGGFTSDLAYLRLLAFRGMSSGTGYEAVQGLARFRSLVLLSMDRYPRDPRPLRVFFEYARNRMPETVSGAASELAESDINLLELALRRLPFLLEADPDLVWLASPLMRDTDAAKRYVAAYRAGGLSQRENFKPDSDSIAAALGFGLIGEIDAVEELFDKFADNENPVLHKKTITDVYSLLSGEEGRDLFTRKLLSFSGEIVSDDDGDGYFESRVFYNAGFISEYRFEKSQSGAVDILISFTADGTPQRVHFLDLERPFEEFLDWERYPSVKLLFSTSGELFLFRPADFQYAPVTFIELGGSERYRGLFFPVPAHYEITRRTLVSSCVSLSRASLEFDGALETIYLERGIPLRSVETFDEKQISVTEFERGIPIIQYVDMDMDGRMETIRRFYPPSPDFSENFDIRKLLASSESDWTGDGQYKTGEVYRQDGSVVYTWDMDGSGIMNYYYQTESGNK